MSGIDFGRLAWLSLIMLAFSSGRSHSALAANSSYQVTPVTRTVALLGNTYIGNAGDDISTPITLPFPVKIYNQSYNSGAVTSNGALCFGAPVTELANTALPASGFPTTIFPYWDDLHSGINAGDGVYTNLSGTSPNRTFAIRWKTVRYEAQQDDVDVEVRLHEGSPNFEILYARADDGGASATVGVQRNSTDYTQYAVNSAVITSKTQLNFTLKPFALSVSDVSVTEGNSGSTTAQFTVSLPYAGSSPVTVAYATEDGTATAGSDYTAQSGKILTFAPGQSSKIVSVEIKGDLLDESDEKFLIKLSSATGATIADASGTGTIVDNDTSSLSVTGSNVYEGHSGTVTMEFVVKLSVPSTREVSFKAKTSSAAQFPATASTDYISLASNTFSLPAGTTSKTLAVSVIGDALDEDTEYIGLTLSNPVNAVLGQSSTQGAILDDDASPTLRVDDVVAAEGQGTGAVNAPFTITLSAPSSKPITVQYATANGSAVAGADYIAPTPSTLTFSPGQTSKVVNVQIKSDIIDELNEKFSFLLSSPTNATLADGTASGTILDDDTSSISATGSTVVEGNTGKVPMKFTLKLSVPNSLAVTVNLRTRNGTLATATQNTDYEPFVSTVSFAAGETTKTVSVNVIGDVVDDEDKEQVGLNLSRPVNAVLATTEDTQGFIIDDDATPSLSIGNTSVDEGNSGQTLATVEVLLSAASGRTVTVQYTTKDGSATLGDNDYVQVNAATLSLPPGTTSKTITLTITGDTKQEADEAFYVDLSAPVAATIAAGKATGTVNVLDDDVNPSMSIDDFVDAGESDADTTVSLTVRLSAPSRRTLTVQYMTVEDTAVAGSDFVDVPLTTLSFAPGETSKTISVGIVANDDKEFNEQFYVVLSGSNGSELTNDTAVVTIYDDDNSGPILYGYSEYLGRYTEGDTARIVINPEDLGYDPDGDFLFFTEADNLQGYPFNDSTPPPPGSTIEIINNQIVITMPNLYPTDPDWGGELIFDFAISDGNATTGDFFKGFFEVDPLPGTDPPEEISKALKAPSSPAAIGSKQSVKPVYPAKSEPIPSFNRS